MQHVVNTVYHRLFERELRSYQATFCIPHVTRPSRYTGQVSEKLSRRKEHSRMCRLNAWNHWFDDTYELSAGRYKLPIL